MKVITVVHWVVDDPITLKLRGTGEATGMVEPIVQNRFILTTENQTYDKNKTN